MKVTEIAKNFSQFGNLERVEIQIQTQKLENKIRIFQNLKKFTVSPLNQLQFSILPQSNGTFNY